MHKVWIAMSRIGETKEKKYIEIYIKYIYIYIYMIVKTLKSNKQIQTWRDNIIQCNKHEGNNM